MKKLIALILSIVMICCLSVTAFAAESPEATEKVTVTIRKADTADQEFKADVTHTVDNGTVIELKADAKYGKFDGWTLYTADGKTLAAATDYEIVSGSLTEGTVTIKLNKSVIICANYDNVKTDPNASSNADDSANAPATGDMTVAYAMVLMLAVVAFGFSAKKVFAK